MGARTMVEEWDGEAEEGPFRLCAVSRARKPPEELIRFVAGPDGAVVPDLARRLPGRGIWVDATRAAVVAAVRQKIFARSLKRQVTVPSDLPAIVERLMARRLAEALSLANKAGLVVSGFVKVEEAIAQGRAAVLVHAAEAAPDGAQKLDRQLNAKGGAEGAGGAVVRELTGPEMSLAMGRPNVVHAAAAEGGATRRLVDEARRLRRYRASEGSGNDRPAPGK
jgi:uncharacterized protein